MNADKMSIEELLSDESFINYCKGVSPGDIAFWENYILENPDKALLVEHDKEQYVQLFNAFALADLEEQAIELSQDVAPRSLLVGSAMQRTDDKTGAGSRIENAVSHAVLPP